MQGPGTVKDPEEARRGLLVIGVRLMTDEWGPVVDEAIDLAVRLVIAQQETPATLEVACLPPGSTRADAEDLIRRMLAEHGVPPPLPPSDHAGRWDYLLDAFTAGALSAADLSWHFAWPSLDKQTPLDTAIVIGLSEWDSETDLDRRESRAEKLRMEIAEYRRSDHRSAE